MKRFQSAHGQICVLKELDVEAIKEASFAVFVMNDCRMENRRPLIIVFIEVVLAHIT